MHLRMNSKTCENVHVINNRATEIIALKTNNKSLIKKLNYIQ